LPSRRTARLSPRRGRGTTARASTARRFPLRRACLSRGARPAGADTAWTPRVGLNVVGLPSGSRRHRRRPGRVYPPVAATPRRSPRRPGGRAGARGHQWRDVALRLAAPTENTNPASSLCAAGCRAATDEHAGPTLVVWCAPVSSATCRVGRVDSNARILRKSFDGRVRAVGRAAATRLREGGPPRSQDGARNVDDGFEKNRRGVDAVDDAPLLLEVWQCVVMASPWISVRPGCVEPRRGEPISRTRSNNS